MALRPGSFTSSPTPTGIASGTSPPSDSGSVSSRWSTSCSTIRRAAGESFLLDGQAIVLDDYLAVRPERAAELAALLRDGRLEAGPWYVLADELIPSGEALVRNLLAGRDAVRRLRGEPPPVLYCPGLVRPSGHPARSARGLRLAADRRSGAATAARAGPRATRCDGRRRRATRCCCTICRRDGYEFGSSLPRRRGRVARRDGSASRRARAALDDGRRCCCSTAPITMPGSGGSREAVRLLATAARAGGGARELAARARRSARRARRATTELPVVRGELRDSYGYTWTLQGTFATRAAQKRRNATAERTLVRDVEPWLALTAEGARWRRACAAARGVARSAARASARHAVRHARSMRSREAFEQRLDTVDVQAAGLRDDALLALVGHDREAARADVEYVAAGDAAAQPVRAHAQRCGGADALGDGGGRGGGAGLGEPPRVLGASPMRSRCAACRCNSSTTTSAWRSPKSPRAYPDADLVVEAHALGWVSEMGGYTVETRAQEEGARGRRPESGARVGACARQWPAARRGRRSRERCV